MQLFPHMTEILILLFLIAADPYELQLKLTVLNDISQRLGLVVNFKKSKIVVFRYGGYLAKHGKWFIGNYNSITLYRPHRRRYVRRHQTHRAAILR